MFASRPPALLDRDLFHARLGAWRVEALEVPVDEGARREEQLAYQRVELSLKLARHHPAQGVEHGEDRREVRRLGGRRL